MTRARDLADSADKDITGTLAVDGINIGTFSSSPSDALNISTSAVNGGVTVSGSTDPQYFLNSAGGNQARFKINDATPMVQTGSWTNIPVGFYTNGTERLRILSTGGITFNGDTAAANALDDYEEGTWTPAVSTASTTHSATGLYTKIGNVVSIQGTIHFTQSGTVFGSISGLPFAVSSLNYTPLAFREWYSTGHALFGNLIYGAQSTTGFWNASNSSTATSGQQYGYAIQAVYRV